MKLHPLVARMWDMSFVSGVGLLVMAGGSEHALGAALLGWIGGLNMGNWLGGLQLDRMIAAAHNMAQVIEAQQKQIAAQREMLDQLQRAVQQIVGDK